MKRVILFGAGNCAKRCLEVNGDALRVLAIADNDKEKTGSVLCGHSIIAPEAIITYDYDEVIITLDESAHNGFASILSIYRQLLDLGLHQSQIALQNMEYATDSPRVLFLKNFSAEVRGKAGAVAECGVWRGAFSGHMSEYFSDRKLYLFDTFVGFDQGDMAQETTKEAHEWLERDKAILSTGNPLFALLRCGNRENVAIEKGWVPETLSVCENERFVFVNLDMDLYAPQLAALRFFAPRMVKGGVILLHDYYWEWTPGVKQAVDAFSQEYEFPCCPIGDDSSIALIF